MKRRQRATAAVAVAVSLCGIVGGTVLFLAAGERDGGEDRIAEILASCAEVAQSEVAECAAVVLDSRADRDGLQEVVGDVQLLSKQDARYGTVCHDIGHKLAQLLARRYQPGELLGVQVESCLWGFEHGVLEGFAMVADDNTFWETLPTVCAGLPEGSQRREQCGHSAGHAVTIKSPGSIFDAETMCSRMLEIDVGSCVGAVLMAYSNTNATLAGGDHIEVQRVADDDVDAMCPRFQEANQQACWMAMWSFYENTVPLAENMRRGTAACEAAGTYQGDCGFGLGQMLLFWGSTFPTGAEETMAFFSRAVEQCSGSTDLKQGCTRGAAYAITNRWFAAGGDRGSYPDICAVVDATDAAACREGRDALLERVTDSAG